MTNIYKITYKIYSAILILFLALQFLAKLLVGFAGHNPPAKMSDHLINCLVVLTIIALIIFKKIPESNINFKNWLRIFLIIFVLIGIVYSFTQLYEFYLLYQQENFGMGDNIPVAIILCFAFLSAILLAGLIRQKV